jgi:RHS repeat-associated protein
MVTSGAASSSQRYLPYGGQRGTAEVATDRRYTGQRWQAQFGLYDYNARWYDPELRRFVQPDTLVPEPGNPQSLNRYAYGLNNPVRYTDPTGRFTESELQDFGFSAELIDQWRMDHRWWSVIVNAQLGDLVEAARRYQGPAGSIGGQFASIADEWRDSYENPALYLSGYGEVESFRQQGAGYELRRYEEGEYRSIDLTAMYAPTVAYVREWYGFDAWRVDWGNVALDAASLATFGAARFAGDAAVALRAEQAGLVLGGVQAGQAGAYMLAGSRSTQDKLQLGLALAGTYPHPIWQGVAGAASLAIDLAPGFVLRQEVVWQ